MDECVRARCHTTESGGAWGGGGGEVMSAGAARLFCKKKGENDDRRGVGCPHLKDEVRGGNATFDGNIRSFSSRAAQKKVESVAAAGGGHHHQPPPPRSAHQASKSPQPYIITYTRSHLKNGRSFRRRLSCATTSPATTGSTLRPLLTPCRRPPSPATCRPSVLSLRSAPGPAAPPLHLTPRKVPLVVVVLR